MFKEIQTALDCLIEAMAGTDEQAIVDAKTTLDTTLSGAAEKYQEDLKTVMSQADEKVAVVTQEKKDLQAQIETQTEDLTEALNSNKHLQTELDEMKAKVTQVTEEHTALEAKFAELTTENEKLEAANKKLAEATGEEHVETLSKTDEATILKTDQSADEIYASAMRKVKARAEQN